jgi:hypothetical protein
MFEGILVPDGTVATAKGDGVALEIGGSAGKIFLLTLTIDNIIEQESLELSIFASSDGAMWDAKPLCSYPQKFYRGEYPFLLDLAAYPDAKFIRAHWDVARWGRGVETPMFEFGVTLREIPADVVSERGAGARVSA